MGVSVAGLRGLRPRSVVRLLLAAILCVVLAYFIVGPPLTPGFKNAARDKCNESVTGDFRSYSIEWKLPTLSKPKPHWECTDLRAPQEPPMNFGWWVKPTMG